MKTTSIILVTGFFLLGCLANLKAQSVKTEEEQLKQYYFVLLIKGAKRDQDSSTVSKIQEAHLANINRLAAEGKLDIAGPFADDTDWRGLFIFNVATEEEVRKLLDTDLAISSGRLNYIIHPWLSAKGATLR